MLSYASIVVLINTGPCTCKETFQSAVFLSERQPVSGFNIFPFLIKLLLLGSI